jgi:hypothetical protein
MQVTKANITQVITPNMHYNIVWGIFKSHHISNVVHFQQYFSYIMAISFSGGGSRSTRRKPSTMGMELINFITCGCESSAPFFAIYKVGREPTPYW